MKNFAVEKLISLVFFWGFPILLFAQDEVPKRFQLKQLEVNEKEVFEDRPTDGIMIVRNKLNADLEFESNEIPNFNYAYDSEKSRYILFFPSGIDNSGINQVVTVKARGYTFQQFTERLKLAAKDVVYYEVIDPDLEAKKMYEKKQDSPWLWVGIAGGLAIGITTAIVIATQVSSGLGGNGTFVNPPAPPAAVLP